MSISIETLGAGPPLVMLHGWGSNSGVWAPVQEKLALSYTLYLVDLPGHGQSPARPPESLDDYARSLANTLPADAHVCAWSLGALVALQLALAGGAESVHRKLLLIASTPRWTATHDWPYAVPTSTLQDFALRMTRAPETTLQEFLALQVLHSDARHATLKALQASLTARGAPQAEGLAQGIGWLAETDFRAQLAHIPCPTLVVHGDRDGVAPVAAGRWLAKELPNAKYVEFARCGHAPFLSHPREFESAALDFLTAS